MASSVSVQVQFISAMQAQEVLRQLRIPELDDFRQYVRGFPTNALMGMGAFAAITTYWFASRPKALKPPCDLTLQSLEIPVSFHKFFFPSLVFHHFFQSDVLSSMVYWNNQSSVQL